jgi:hypothetical protein
MSDLKMTNAGDYMADDNYGLEITCIGELAGFPVSPDQLLKIDIPNNPVGAWDLGSFQFSVSRLPTDEQIKNTEEMFGWKWVDL